MSSRPSGRAADELRALRFERSYTRHAEGSVLVGFGLPDDRIHAPNEKFDIGQFHAGIRVLTRLWDELAANLPRRAPARS